MWHYKELYSCPLTLDLGTFEYMEVRGRTLLPILNYRVNVLVDYGGRLRVTSNIPFKTWRERVERICLYIMAGRFRELDMAERIEAYAMFYGGLGSYAIINGDVHVVLLDLVNRSKFWFYLDPLEQCNQPAMQDLKNTVLLHLAFREGLVEVLKRVCESSGKVEGSVCELKTNCGTLYVLTKPLDRTDGLLLVVPENAPLRHVIAYVEGLETPS